MPNDIFTQAKSESKKFGISVTTFLNMQIKKGIINNKSKL